MNTASLSTAARLGAASIPLVLTVLLASAQLDPFGFQCLFDLRQERLGDLPVYQQSF